MNKDLTVGSPGRSLIMFTIPLFISVMFQQMYNIADSVIAGKFAGEDALAAIGASYPITMIFMAVAVGCQIGCSVVISKHFARQHADDQDLHFHRAHFRHRAFRGAHRCRRAFLRSFHAVGADA